MKKKQHLEAVVKKEIKEKIPNKNKAIYEALGKFKDSMSSS